jgi:hypothetical protein
MLVFSLARLTQLLPQDSLACPSTLRPFDRLRAGKLRTGRLRMYGSMVLTVYLYFVFRSQSEKTKYKKKEKYRCE